MERVLNTLVDKLKKAQGARLVSVVLYGSGAGDDRDAKFSDYNILCVLSQITPRELADAEPVFRWWREQGNPSPLLLSEEEVRTSTDCFPIEFHDIGSGSIACWLGADVIADARDRRFVLPRAGGARTARQSCCDCARRPRACCPTPSCCAACWPTRCPRSACCSATRCGCTGSKAAWRSGRRWRQGARFLGVATRLLRAAARPARAAASNRATSIRRRFSLHT